MKFVILLAAFLPHWSAAVSSSTASTSQQLYSIKGTLPVNFSGKQLLLYKYKSAFEQELISEIEVQNHTFVCQKELVEPDAYLLKNPLDNTFFTFIWDGNLTVDLTDSKFYEPRIMGSPLSTELSQFNQTVQAKYFQPIHKVDSLIDRTKEKTSLDSLRQLRRDLMDWASSGSEAYRLKYYRDHPDSFVSLFLLTLSGDRLPIEPDYRGAFEGLSNRLKQHSRADYYLKR